ncbi:MAG: tetratricopeptide repeat protein [Pseudomonadota bacterium]
MGQEPEARLVGWKRIANHLRCSERTARRWEREEQLPVHRQQHERRSTIYALPSELDAWVASRSSRPPSDTNADEGSTPERRVAIVLAVGLVIGLIGGLFLRTPAAPTEPVAALTTDPVAADLYERGQALWRQRGEVPNARAIKLLTQAVARDEAFAEAWSALALAWLTYPTYNSDVSTDKAIDEALLAADRAAQLDPTLAEPRSVMASVAQRRGLWLDAERIYVEALADSPENTTLMLWLAGLYRELGMMERADATTRSALALDPNSPPILTEVAMNDKSLGREDASRKRLDYLWFDLGVQTPVVWVGRWFTMTESGDYEGARAWIEQTPLAAFKPIMTRYVEYLTDPTAPGAERFGDELVAAHRAGFPAWLAFYMLDQADLPDAALDVLDFESVDGTFDTSVVLFYPSGGAARATPRFAELVARLGYFEYWKERGAPDICQSEPAIRLCTRMADGQR